MCHSQTMVFLDPSAIIACSVLVFLVALGVIGFCFARRKTGLIRLLFRIGSIVILAGCLVVTAAWRLGAALAAYSVPIYSPDHKHAFRVEEENIDSRGVTRVYLYSDHGLVVNRVFEGIWRSTKVEDIHWLTNSEASILYEYSTEKYLCASTRDVKVSVQRRFPILPDHKP